MEKQGAEDLRRGRGPRKEGLLDEMGSGPRVRSREQLPRDSGLALGRWNLCVHGAKDPDLALAAAKQRALSFELLEVGTGEEHAL